MTSYFVVTNSYHQGIKKGVEGRLHLTPFTHSFMKIQFEEGNLGKREFLKEKKVS
jgi:hypothetical protein